MRFSYNVQIFQERLSEEVHATIPKGIICGWLWVHQLFFKEIWKNGTGDRGHMIANAKGKQQKYRFHSYSVRNSVFIISHIAFVDCCVHNFSDPIFLEIAVYALLCICHWCNNSILQGPWRDTIWRGCIHHKTCISPWLPS